MIAAFFQTFVCIEVEAPHAHVCGMTAGAIGLKNRRYILGERRRLLRLRDERQKEPQDNL